VTLERCIAVLIAALVALAIAFGPDDPHAATTRAHGVKSASVATVQGKGVVWWARRAVQARKDANARAATIRRLQRVIAGDVTIQASIDLAAIAYHVDDATLRRKASCESTGGHGYNPNAFGPLDNGEHPIGLFQFKPSTWATTPYARFSPFDPLAAALAAGWMHANGRGGEWACR
jgi:hypothetical protein